MITATITITEDKATSGNNTIEYLKNLLNDTVPTMPESYVMRLNITSEINGAYELITAQYVNINKKYPANTYITGGSFKRANANGSGIYTNYAQNFDGVYSCHVYANKQYYVEIYPLDLDEFTIVYP